MSTEKVSIPIVPYGLRPEETIVQIATALDNIASLIDAVFQKVDENIMKHKNYLFSLQKRSEIVAAKVDQIASRKDVATTIYSHYKFPAQNNSFDTLSDFSLIPLVKKPGVPIEDKFQHIKYNNTLSKLKFFHLKPQVNSEGQELILEKGLGEIPLDAEHISSLLLFNTAENLYQKYVQVDPLAVSPDSITNQVEIEKNDIAAAPISIVTDQVFQNEGYFKEFYTPAYEEVPSIDVPFDLPDLPGIAGNMKMNFSHETVIAPTKRVLEEKVNKPIEEISASDLPQLAKPKLTEGIETCAEKSNLPEFDKKKQSNIPAPGPFATTQCIIISSNSPSPAPPPPPLSSTISVPPPPPPLPQLEDASSSKTEPSFRAPVSKLPSAPAENLHDSLMAAIRQAGGKEKAKLRPVDNTESKVKPIKNSGDTQSFLGELYNTLAMRRKGISGHKDKGNVHILDRVSELMTASSESSANSDNETNSDWED